MKKLNILISLGFLFLIYLLFRRDLSLGHKVISDFVYLDRIEEIYHNKEFHPYKVSLVSNPVFHVTKGETL